MQQVNTLQVCSIANSLPSEFLFPLRAIFFNTLLALREILPSFQLESEVGSSGRFKGKYIDGGISHTPRAHIKILLLAKLRMCHLLGYISLVNQSHLSRWYFVLKYSQCGTLLQVVPQMLACVCVWFAFRFKNFIGYCNYMNQRVKCLLVRNTCIKQKAIFNPLSPN